MTWVMMAVITVYVQSAHALSNSQSAEVWRCLQMSLSFMVMFAYANQAGECFTTVGAWPNKVQLISLGIVMSWMSVFFNGAWGTFWRLSGQPPWMVNNDLYQSWVMFNCVAASLHILAPNLIGAGVPTIDRVRLGSAFALAGLLIALLSIVRPDLSEWSEVVRPYFETTTRLEGDGDESREIPEPHSHRSFRESPFATRA